LPEGKKAIKKIYGYVASAVHYGLLAFGFIASQQFGIEATSILALFGAASDSASLSGGIFTGYHATCRKAAYVRDTIRGHGVWKGHAMWP
jgi:hypothetical protein